MKEVEHPSTMPLNKLGGIVEGCGCTRMCTGRAVILRQGLWLSSVEALRMTIVISSAGNLGKMIKPWCTLVKLLYP